MKQLYVNGGAKTTKTFIKNRNGPPAFAQVNLLAGVEPLTNPNYHELNKHAGRNDRLLHAVLCAYAKHHLGCDDIGWDQLGDMLQSVICNEIGDDAFCRWLETMQKD